MNRLKLIDNWHQAWRWLSVQAAALGAALVYGYTYLPDEFKTDIPPAVRKWAAGAAFAAVILGRLIDQTPKVKPTDEIQK